MFTQEQIQALLNVLPERKEDAINAPELARALGYSSLPNQEELRALIRQAIRENHLIGSDNSGYWLINSLDELEDILDSLERRAKRTCDRRNHLLNAWNEKYPDNLSIKISKDVN
ncbi:hypothetical protein LS482_08705 [Sinomicrobium kalidii]|uniref:hypothetical protein n=1 Tax=Sinomicrobium kalidii TaxID=2900738 RepID=UPI001E5EAFD2|nr:hypothetical protein [Sinomicrobium kalidii]UGU17947.1 hypothetical protein LS482_08705 [Sinomicrobium kalidii]